MQWVRLFSHYKEGKLRVHFEVRRFKGFWEFKSLEVFIS